MELYARWWTFETDLRTLKQTVGLETLGARSPEMVGKELVLGVAAYDPVRTLMAFAADRAGVEPRRLGFSRARARVEAYAGRELDGENLGRMLESIVGRTLPERKEGSQRKIMEAQREIPPRQNDGQT